MIRLFTTYYNDSDKNRQKELDFCLKKNNENSYIDEIWLIKDKKELPFKSNKIKIPSFKIESEPPTYLDFFKIINENVNKNDILIISNTDIFFDETIKYSYNIKDDELYTLLRWEYDENNSKLYNNGIQCSQDSWIWRGKMDDLNYSDFNLGRLGCDNRIAWEFKNKGYKVKNPAKTIKSYHVHSKQTRKKHDERLRIPRPYYFIKPHE